MKNNQNLRQNLNELIKEPTDRPKILTQPTEPTRGLKLTKRTLNFENLRLINQTSSEILATHEPKLFFALQKRYKMANFTQKDSQILTKIAANLLRQIKLNFTKTKLNQPNHATQPNANFENFNINHAKGLINASQKILIKVKQALFFDANEQKNELRKFFLLMDEIAEFYPFLMEKSQKFSLLYFENFLFCIENRANFHTFLTNRPTKRAKQRKNATKRTLNFQQKKTNPRNTADQTQRKRLKNG